MKNLKLVFVIILTLQLISNSYAQYVPSGYTLAWGDDFNTSSLDLSCSGSGTWSTFWCAWNTRRLYDNSDDGVKMDDSWKGISPPAGAKNIQQVLTEAGWPSPSLHDVSNGSLKMRAYPIPAAYQTQFDWYGATNPSAASMISSEMSHSQLYGYWEVRAKLNGTPKNKHFSLWFLQKESAWPPEIDMLETVIDNSNPGAGILSSCAAHGSSQDGINFFNPAGGMLGVWHSYGFLWTTTDMIWYVDGNVVRSQPNYLSKPLYFLASWEIGGNWEGNTDSSTPWPAEMELDYVRAYSTSGAAAPSIVLTSPSAGANQTGTTVSLTATVTSADAVTKVDFFADKILVGTDNDGTNGWSATWSNPVTGTYELSAIATTINNASGTSAKVRVPVGQQNNLISNPGLEEGAAGWSSSNAGIATDKAHTGDASLKITADNSGSWRVIGLKANTTYQFSGSGISAGLAFLFVKDFGGTEVDATFTDAVNWQNKTVSFTTGSAYTSATIGVWQSGGSTASWMDDFFLSEVTAICTIPSGITFSTITTTGATINWTSTGASSYNVQYKLSTASTWTTVSALTNSTTLSGLTAGATYNVQVQSVCGGTTSAYSTVSSFTTSAPLCNVPSGISFSTISNTGATVNWTSTGAASYNVQYKMSSASTWTTLSASTNSISLTGLTASTTYNVQVQSVCGSTSSAYSTVSSFTTLVSKTCGTDAFESNDTRSTAHAVTVNATSNGLICPATDVDWFKFSNTSTAKNIKITLTNLPADYDLYLYNSKGKLLKSSTNRGTTDELVVYNTSSVGTYYIQVNGYNGATNNSLLYSLNVIISSTTQAIQAVEPLLLNQNSSSTLTGVNELSGVPTTSVYPNPFNTNFTLKISDETILKNTVIKMYDISGREIKSVFINSHETIIDKGELNSGIYFYSIINNNEKIANGKLVVQ